jgi:solute carrier family 8 (sodium/calcium exchanger)
MQATIRINLIDTEKFDRDEIFKVILFDPKGPITDVKIHRHENGVSSGESVVTIKSDGAAKNFRDRMQAAMSVSMNKYQLGNSSYAEQFRTALLVNGGEEDDDEPPACMDYFMHYLTLPFKLFFATVPPSSYKQGWVTFVVALVYIGLVTALIQDLAMLFGCAVGLEDSITAITVVALGTSLPDTFASKTATIADDTADAAVGNVTGSNCVNVFLGLGLPWGLASIKWQLSGVTSAWEAKYGKKEADGTITAGNDVNLPELIADYPNGGFVVPAGSLGFSVTVFTCCSLCCFALLYYRRTKFGFELGGPKKEANISAVILVCLWLIYIIMSSLEAYGILD